MEALDLVKEAKKARQKAYAPYSGFAVGAALLAKSGRVYHGCNVENASYGACICAEQVAVVKAVSEGEKEFVALAVVAMGKVPISPCGICRQVLSEFGTDLQVVMATLDGEMKIASLADLLPYAFGVSNLEGEL